MFPFVLSINPAGWFHLLFFGLGVPGGELLSRLKSGKTERPLPSRLLHYQTTVITIVLLGVLSLIVARSESMRLFPRAFPGWRSMVAGVLVLAGMIAYMRPRWRRAVERRARIVHLYMPQNTTERLWWIAVAVLAGIAEEITWRGVQQGLLGHLTGSFWLAAIICAIAFGLGHLVQGWRSVIVVIAFALAFNSLVWLSGSLYVAMVVHVTYDITAGLSYGRLGKELGYSLGPPAETSEAVTISPP